MGLGLVKTPKIGRRPVGKELLHASACSYHGSSQIVSLAKSPVKKHPGRNNRTNMAVLKDLAPLGKQ